jgi:hypothetical protein
MDRSSASVRPGWESRPVPIPDDVDDPSVTKASGRVRLPLHIYRSGDDPQNKQWDLDDPLQRELVYRMVMSEGNEDDVRYFIDVDQLIAMWPDLFLPRRVRETWAVWLREHRGVPL